MAAQVALEEVAAQVALEEVAMAAGQVAFEKLAAAGQFVVAMGGVPGQIADHYAGIDASVVHATG